MQKSNALKTLNIIHKALMMGQVIFAAAVVFLAYTKTIEPSAKELDRSLQVVALLLTVGGIFAGTSIFKKKLLQLREKELGAKEKFAQYRSASIIQWALLEGPSLFCIICYFLTGNYAFLALMVVMLFLFAMAAPTRMKVLLQLQISEAELDEL